ncbi:Nitrogen permease regulator 3 [Coemansia sp. RSA 989]|nr:nitrogen permease regulator of amino acid transport activity 3-domain-containing protein [Coemansia mojavensis]KAJ1865849.1 Nitrogen permease regulator 3 [Coemansia sp. RSA 989]KAJ1873102.1 Nitrogen permease regulator 3 [Coemansia sp. RSA 990]KAJ2669877.1 Nitrogen permease regulator 3 [Coemansia sp. RSA 1085]
MNEGDAILGVFLATYSSKGDYLPLRYPISEFDYEYAEMLLKERTQRRSPQSDKSSDAAAVGVSEAVNGEQTAETQAANASTSAVTTADKKDSAPSRNDSYSSVANVSSNPMTPISAAPSGSTVAAGKGGSRGESKPRGGSATGGESADGGRGSSDSENVPYMEQKMRGFEMNFLAQLFSPRPSMSDQRFQVAIDNVLFVGHPLRDDPKEKTRDPDYYDAEQDETETMSRLAEFEGWKIKTDSVAQPGSNQQGTRVLADLGLMSLMLNREPSETGDSAISEGERAVRDSKEWKRRGYWKRVYPKLFHVVFMLDNTVPGSEELADRIYDHVLKRLTKTLMIEQMETNYVLTQSRLIRSLNDLALSEKYTPAQYLQEIIRTSDLAIDLIELYNGLRKGELVNLHIHKRIMLTLQIPRGPPLARPLPVMRGRTVLNAGYNAIGHNSANPNAASINTSTVQTPRPATPADAAAAAAATASRSVAPAVQEYWGPIVFAHDSGGSVHISSSSISHGTTAHGLPSKLSLLTGNMGSTHGLQGVVVTGRELQPGERDGYPHIEPYHAVLLLEDVAVLRRRLLYSDASPTLITIIEKASPTRPLVTLHALVDCSFAQLCRFVAHLVYWNVARLICPVNLSFTYVPTATPMSPRVLSRFDAREFSLCTLPQLLSALDPPRPALRVLESLTTNDNDGSGSDVREARAEFRDMLVLLLREDVIAQLHTWPVVLVPNYVKFNLSEEQFVRLSLAWFRSLQTEHPDLLGAFPDALLDKAELESWAVDQNHERADMELVEQAAHEAEDAVMLCRTMRKLALRRIHDVLDVQRAGKHGKELQLIDQKIASEEHKIHAFCNRVERERLDTWIHAMAQHGAIMEQTRNERIQARRAHGKDIPESGSTAKDSTLHAWYDFVKKDPDLSQFAREVTSKYVSFVPTDPPPHRTEAERRYMHRLVRGRPASQQDWFHRHSHLFTGSNHLVKLLGAEQASIARLEAMLREFDGVVLLPQHI